MKSVIIVLLGAVIVNQGFVYTDCKEDQEQKMLNTIQWFIRNLTLVIKSLHIVGHLNNTEM